MYLIVLNYDGSAVWFQYFDSPEDAEAAAWVWAVKKDSEGRNKYRTFVGKEISENPTE